MSLETMTPNPGWDGDADALSPLGDDRLTFKVWGADWCGDCEEQLPDFAAALDAVGVPGDRIEQFPVDRDKQGDRVDAYGVEYIPTVVVERDGEEIARFVEEEDRPIAEYLAAQLAEAPSA
ncbi:MAG: TlpA family protein disulfide reductase [Haloferacaceae archaeon]